MAPEANDWVRLLRWVPKGSPVEFEPTFFNIHMHPKMTGTFKRALGTACFVWPILMAINHFDEIFQRHHFAFLLGGTSVLTFLVPLAVSFISRVTETQ